MCGCDGTRRRKQMTTAEKGKPRSIDERQLVQVGITSLVFALHSLTALSFFLSFNSLLSRLVFI